jgi:N-carbamoyl-L-amino-acid hydrolase
MRMNRREFARQSALLVSSLSLSLPTRARFVTAFAPLRVNGARLNHSLQDLSRYGRNPQGGVTRLAYSDADRQGRLFIRQLMAQSGLTVRFDAAGNVIGRLPGRNDSKPVILCGSHADSVPEGGNYDGDVGTLGAIEVARSLHEQGVVTEHPLEVVCWQNEEGYMMGSKMAAGNFNFADLDQKAASGKTLREGTTYIGGDPSRLQTARRAKGSVACYFELHIEQGGILEREHVNIGVVQGIVGIWEWTVTVTGFANHAGTTPMDQRHDALLSAARFVEMANRVVRSEPGRQVATVGTISAEPGAPNVIPGRVVLSLEMRDLDASKVMRLQQRIVDEAHAIGKADGTNFSFAGGDGSAPAMCDPELQKLIANAAKELSLTAKAMPSGAGHDAQEIARIAPVGMIFVPSVGGISHSPKEFSRPEDIERGANVLLNSVLAADRFLARA